MNRFKKLLYAMLTAVLISIYCGTPVLAAPSTTYAPGSPEANDKAVVELAGQLEDKYGITILYPTNGEGYRQLSEIFPEMLETLDMALETVTPELVRQVSSYYYNITGRRLTYSYTYADLRGIYGYARDPEVVVGTFDSRNARIDIYIPQHKGEAVATGDNPLTIVHEFGHALHLMLTEQHGYAKMEDEWNALMDNALYGQEQTDPRVFITDYASTDFEEDFADTVAHVFICDRPGLGLAYRLYEGRDELSALGRKVQYIERLIEKYIHYSQRALENYRKIYKTPASVNEAGLKLSGPHLIFKGYDEPRTVPLMLLKNLYVNERQTVWFSEIGGWYCQDIYGNHLVLFPEGTYGNPGKNLLEQSEPV